MPRLLIIDDEPNVLFSLEAALEADDLQIVTARTAKQGIEAVRANPFDLVITDVRLPDLSGLEAFAQIHQLDPKLPVIVITAFGSTETAIEAMKRGAFEYLLKPVDLHRLRDVVKKAIELRRFATVPARLMSDVPEDASADRIIGDSLVMQEVYKAIGRVAGTDSTVLIVGESGTGKELIARAIYQHSSRSDRPFLAMNCAAIPEALLESELFGYERGAFTGAERQHIGKFEQANGGTLFLDEIGDMSLSTQAKVLRLLQEQQFERLAGHETISTDVRLIAATNQDLELLVQQGRFRQDLMYRMNGFLIRLPSLRERKGDVPLLADYFLKTINHRLGKDVRVFSLEAMRRLEIHRWPGNVRELQSAVRYALLQTVGDVITPDSLPNSLRDSQSQVLTPTKRQFEVSKFTEDLLQNGSSEIYRKVIQGVDRVLLECVLEFVRGNQVHASEILGISRTTLRSKMEQLGIGMARTPRLPDRPNAG
jgi:nitrogen regulation protein NR(I)